MSLKMKDFRKFLSIRAWHFNNKKINSKVIQCIEKIIFLIKGLGIGPNPHFILSLIFKCDYVHLFTNNIQIYYSILYYINLYM